MFLWRFYIQVIKSLDYVFHGQPLHRCLSTRRILKAKIEVAELSLSGTRLMHLGPTGPHRCGFVAPCKPIVGAPTSAPRCIIPVFTETRALPFFSRKASSAREKSPAIEEIWVSPAKYLFKKALFAGASKFRTSKFYIKTIIQKKSCQHCPVFFWPHFKTAAFSRGWPHMKINNFCSFNGIAVNFWYIQTGLSPEIRNDSFPKRKEIIDFVPVSFVLHFYIISDSPMLSWRIKANGMFGP